MARKSQEKTDYIALTKVLRENGPDRLYLLWGEEDYLRESYMDELKKLCLGDGGDSSFNYHRLAGEGLDLQALSQAVNSVPFLGERSLIEVRNFAVNDYKDETAERLKDILSDIPEFATAALLLPVGVSPDGRLGLTKFLKKQGSAIEFTAQNQSMLTNWIKRHFAAFGKEIDTECCERLIFLSGSLMTGLIPEIEKIAAFTSGNKVTAQEIEELTMHIPEARVFEMTDCLSRRQFDRAGALLSDLMESGEHPIKTLAMIGMQFRRLYTARVAIDTRRGRDFLIKTHGLVPYAADKLLDAAKGFSMERLVSAVELCAQSDYLMKSSSSDDEDILKDLFLRLAAG